MKRIILLVVCMCIWVNTSHASHIVNGSFDSSEWDGVTPQTGIYSYFYYEWENNDLYIMNDWWNTDSGFQLGANQWNTFLFNDSQGDNWEFRVYNDNTVKVWENNVEYTGQDIIGAYGFGPSLLKSESHTLYETRINGTIIGSDYYPIFIEKDPRQSSDQGDGGWTERRFSSVPEPSTMFLLGSLLTGIIGFGRKRLF